MSLELFKTNFYDNCKVNVSINIPEQHLNDAAEFLIKQGICNEEGGITLSQIFEQAQERQEETGETIPQIIEDWSISYVERIAMLFNDIHNIIE